MKKCEECGGKLKVDQGQDPDGTYFTVITCNDCGLEPSETGSEPESK